MKTLEVRWGEYIDEAIRRAIAEPDGCQFEFNGIVVEVTPNSDAKSVCKEWHRAREIYIEAADKRTLTAGETAI